LPEGTRGVNRCAEVAGGGIAGLTVAAALAQRGWSVRVHERGAELREIGAGIFVWENGLRALEAVGAFDQATARAELIQRWELRDERARKLQGSWMKGAARLYLVLRTELHRALVDACQRSGVELLTSSTVAHVTADGDLVLDSGESSRSDLIIGADGVFSRVRDGLQLAVGVRDLEDGCGRHLIRRTNSDPKNVTLEYWQSGRRIGICPCSPEDVYVYLCCPADDVDGRAKPLNVESWTRSFPRFRDVIERIPDTGRWATFHDVIAASWHRGRVALVGDAAHAMSPNLGQGANLAMTSGVGLAQALDRHAEVPAALEAWERSERPIVDATQGYSRFYGRMGTSWPGWALDARSAVVWGIGRSSRLQSKVNVAAHHFPALGPTQSDRLDREEVPT
jgi:2-polyprenyl-6-methoxyphenol hydroxylase-like FAD-dependent oxidoreductase